MTRIIETQLIECFYDRGGQVYTDIELRKCTFESCAISITRDPAKRSIFRNIKITNCSVRGCAIDTAIIEDTVVDGLRTYNGLGCWGGVFKHVVLKGRVGQILIEPTVAPGMATPEEQRAFDEANRTYYESVDWALDISEARFIEADIRGIPAKLIRRDPETQVVVTREKALEGKWQSLDLSRTWWATTISHFLDRSNETDIVLTAPKRHSRYEDALEGLKRLRDAGVAEPD